MAKNLGECVPLHLSAFHPDYKLTDRSATPPSTLARSRRIALENGLKYVYTGNVHDSVGGSTHCKKCGKVVIERDWYQIKQYNLDQ